MKRALVTAILAALACAPGAAAQAPYDGRNPFECELQQAGTGTDIPHPQADPLCIEYDKTRQDVSDGTIVDFLSNEPARFGLAGDKCFYFQHDHWRSRVATDDERTETYSWDGSYFFDRARGIGGAYVENFTINNETGDPTTFPGFPPEWEPYFGPGRGGMRSTTDVPIDRRCVERARQGGIYAQRETPPTDPPPGSQPYGLVASNANFVPGRTVEERAANYRRLYDAGVRAIRLDINWQQVEPVGQPLQDYDFRERDREVEAIRRAGLKVIGLLAYGHPDYSRLGGTLQRTPLGDGIPPFYVGRAEYHPPDDPADFARYARATAAHYGDDVIAWEIWNEQNEGWRFWAPREDPPRYARLLCAAHAAVKSEDPATPVLYGGVFFPALPGGLPGMSGPDFLQATYDADPNLGRCFDVLAYHPYPYPFTAPELDVPIRGSVLSAADTMRGVLERNGDGRKPLWITEVGWPTHDRTYGVAEEKQAQYVARMQAASFAQGLPVVTWYTYGDGSDPSGANQEAWFGLFRPDGSAKPSYRALATFSRVFEGARFTRDRSRELGLPAGRLLTGGRGFALEFARGDTRVTALWLANESGGEGQGRGAAGGTLGPKTVTVRLPVSGGTVRVVDHLGAEREVAAAGGRVTLLAGPGPVYVVDG